MKKFLLGLLMSFSMLSAKATHLMGGDMVVRYDTSINQYILTLTYYRDTLGVPMYLSEQVEFFSWDATTSSYNTDSLVSIPLDVAQSTLLLPNFPYGVEVGVYCDTFSLPVGKYRFVSNTCCRNGAILNASNPLSESIIVHTDLEVDTLNNSSPGCLAMPVAYFPENTAITYNPLPYDPDGDSIAWSLNTPIGYYTNNPVTFTPVAGFVPPASDPTGPFTMNAITGQISWTPDTVGNYIQSFIIDEYRNGVQIGSMVRDMQYVVIPQSGNSSPLFVPVTPYQTNVSQNYYYAYYTPGTQFDFQLQGVDPDNGNQLSMQAISEIMKGANPATFSVIGSGNNIIGYLKWTPSTEFSKDVIVVFRLGDGVFAQDFTLLLRKNPAATNVKTFNNPVRNFSVYPNPARQNINLNIDLQKDIYAAISVYNTLGQQVAEIYNGKLMKGSSTLTSNIHLSSGIYNIAVRENGTMIKSVKLVVE